MTGLRFILVALMVQAACLGGGRVVCLDVISGPQIEYPERCCVPDDGCRAQPSTPGQMPRLPDEPDCCVSSPGDWIPGQARGKVPQLGVVPSPLVVAHNPTISAECAGHAPSAPEFRRPPPVRLAGLVILQV